MGIPSRAIKKAKDFGNERKKTAAENNKLLHSGFNFKIVGVVTLKMRYGEYNFLGLPQEKHVSSYFKTPSILQKMQKIGIDR